MPLPLPRRLKLILAACLLGPAFIGPAAHAESAPAPAARVVVVKADDVRGPAEKWKRFFALSESLGVKVSAGIICDSLENAGDDYVAWLRELDRSGRVEFWHHGWDHKRWTTEAGAKLREFHGSGFEHQQRHYTQAKAQLVRVFGRPPIAFGAPFNSTDADTAKILAADPDLKLVFANNERATAGKTASIMALRGEHDGTGKPNFEKFREEYATKPTLTAFAFQIHPAVFTDAHFEEYAKIVRFLLAEGWTFALPREVVPQ